MEELIPIAKGLLDGGTLGTSLKIILAMLVIGISIWWAWKGKGIRIARARKQERERTNRDQGNIGNDVNEIGEEAKKSESKIRNFLKKFKKKYRPGWLI